MVVTYGWIYCAVQEYFVATPLILLCVQSETFGSLPELDSGLMLPFGLFVFYKMR